MHWEMRHAHRFAHSFLVYACSHELWKSLGRCFCHWGQVIFFFVIIYLLGSAAGRGTSGRVLVLELNVLHWFWNSTLFLPHLSFNRTVVAYSLLHFKTNLKYEKNYIFYCTRGEFRLVLQSHLLVLSPVSPLQTESHGKWICLCTYYHF